MRDTRNCSNGACKALHESRASLRIDSRTTRVDINDQHALAVEAERHDAELLERSNEESCRDEQNHGQCDLRCDEAAVHMNRAGSASQIR